MKTYFVTMRTGYAGSTQYDLLEVADDTPEDVVDDIAWEMAIENAGSFGYELCDCDDEECDMEHLDSTGIEGSAVPYVPEEHDMYL